MRSPKPEYISVFEYQSIAYRGKYANSKFSEGMFNAFEAYFRANEKTPFFELIPSGVRFLQYVGAIQIGNVVIEVLPKAGKTEKPEIWQKVLLDMLKVCQLLVAKEAGEANLKLKSNSILELYFELYISELESLLHRGLIKKYRTVSSQQKALKGALVFSEHVKRNLVHKERFYTRHPEYNKEHLLHQILYEALLLILQLSNSTLLNDRIGRIILDFPTQNRIKITQAHFDRLSEGRKTQPYKKAIEIARLLLLNYRPDISAGRNNLIALMFDMNKLWEEYIYRVLSKNLKDTWWVKRQESELFWEKQTIRPDIVLQSKQNPETVFVLDTKWKIIKKGRPEDSDLKQMYVYNHHWKSSHSILVYPKAGELEDRRGQYALPNMDGLHSCSLAFIDVVNDSGLRDDIASQVELKLV